jgi:hypothetical protein
VNGNRSVLFHSWDRLLKGESGCNTLRGEIDVPRLNITGDFPPMEELFNIVEILLSKGYTTLAEHHLPNPDISINEIKTISEGETRIAWLPPFRKKSRTAELMLLKFQSLPNILRNRQH